MLTPRTTLTAATLAAALALTACTNTSAAPAATEPAATTAAPEPTEGPATQPAVWEPEKLTVTLDRVEKVPNKWAASDIPADHVLVRLTYTTRNQAPIPLPSGNITLTLLHGPNRQEAQQPTAYSGVPKAQLLQSEDPTRIAAGGSAEGIATFQVPAAELADLAAQVRVPNFDDGGTTNPRIWTFTGLHKILK